MEKAIKIWWRCKRCHASRRNEKSIAWLDQFMVSRTTKINLDNEEHEDLSFNHQQEDKSDEEEA